MFISDGLHQLLLSFLACCLSMLFSRLPPTIQGKPKETWHFFIVHIFAKC